MIDLGLKNVISLPNSNHICIPTLNLNCNLIPICHPIRKLPEPSLHLRIPAPFGLNLARALCDLPSMVTEGCHQGVNLGWCLLVSRNFPSEAEGKRAGPEKGDGNVTLSSLSLGPKRYLLRVKF